MRSVGVSTQDAQMTLLLPTTVFPPPLVPCSLHLLYRWLSICQWGGGIFVRRSNNTPMAADEKTARGVGPGKGL